MTRYEKIWEQIRADWVNGNKRHSRERFLNLEEYDRLSVIRAALDWHWEHHINGNSGALTDLRELLTFIVGV